MSINRRGANARTQVGGGPSRGAERLPERLACHDYLVPSRTRAKIRGVSPPRLSFLDRATPYQPIDARNT